MTAFIAARDRSPGREWETIIAEEVLASTGESGFKQALGFLTLSVQCWNRVMGEYAAGVRV